MKGEPMKKERVKYVIIAVLVILLIVFSTLLIIKKNDKEVKTKVALEDSVLTEDEIYQEVYTEVLYGKEKYNYSICVFPNGKIYHCDLNASYNIGARYFIRELLKSESVMTRLPAEANDLRYGTGTTRTLSTLIRLNADLCATCA